MRLFETCPLFVDAQTTGATPERGRLLELAWQVGAQELRSFVVSGPGGASDDVAPRILKLTGIARADLEKARPEDEIYAALAADMKELEGGIVVAHFASFETRFLEDLWQRLAGRGFPSALVCTHAICRRLFPDLPSRSLHAVAGYFGAPISPSKRAGFHVEATARIWSRLCAELEARESIGTLSELQEWLTRKAPTRTGARAYPIERTLRLGLPDRPGVYKMLGSDGRVLYVGKATSLRSRVNSYFRQRKGHSTPKLELLTQVFGLETVVCETVLEAALLESDEIKRLNPPYNVALRTESRRVAFFDRDWTEVAEDEACYGPFGSPLTFDQLKALRLALSGLFTPEEVLILLFYEEVDPAILRQGLMQFRAAHGWTEGRFLPSVRHLVARGLRLVKESEAAVELEEDELEDPEEALLPEDVHARLDEVLLHSAKAYVRARKLRRLLDSAVAWRRPTERLWRWLVIRGGVVAAAGYSEDASPPDLAALSRDLPLPERGGIDIPTYDRVRVLGSELARMASEGTSVILRHEDVFRGSDDGVDGKLQAARHGAAAYDRADSPGMSP